ncbi:MAG: sulfur carrier protein ThiS [Chloroflexi bacterium]|nr:sulfur carrier protein ThiS [Chloroflexota bacterium]
MRLTVNGKPRDVDAARTIAEFLHAHDVNPQLVAVEHNGRIVRREQFSDIELTEGDALEIIHMVGGG